MKERLVVPSLIFGACLIIAALLFTGTWQDNQKTISVVGSAKKDIVSDLGFLRGSVVVEDADVGKTYQRLQQHRPLLLAYLERKGFPPAQVKLFPPSQSAVPEYDSEGRDTGRVLKYAYYQRFEMQSSDVRKIEDLALDIASLIEQGVYIQLESPEYHYTKLAEVKVEIQALAAHDAMTRAQKIAEATQCQLGLMRTARMGVLQITPRFSTMVSDYGVNDATSIEKEITAVVQASFAIE